VLDRSRSWVEEEGEVFRKGQALLSEEEMESEYAGEELRQGVCHFITCYFRNGVV
jgi:protein phosphatase 1 regulatory subunit 37